VKEKNMFNEQKDPQPKKTTDQMGLWVVIGLGIGTLIGFLYHNIPIGITMGAALGLVFGAASSLKNKKD
jgi:uncharacterized membrane protein